MLALIITLVGLTAAVLDWRTGKIPNLLTFPAMLLGIGCTVWEQGAVSGLCRCFLLLGFAFFGRTQLLGMGDLKLLMAFAALGGMRFACVAAFLASALVLVTELILHRKDTLMDIRAGLYTLWTMQPDVVPGTGRKIKFAPYLLCGAIGGCLCGWI